MKKICLATLKKCFVNFPGFCGFCWIDNDENCVSYELVSQVVGAQLCWLSPVDAHTVALKPVMGK